MQRGAGATLGVFGGARLVCKLRMQVWVLGQVCVEHPGNRWWAVCLRACEGGVSMSRRETDTLKLYSPTQESVCPL